MGHRRGQGSLRGVWGEIWKLSPHKSYAAATAVIGLPPKVTAMPQEEKERV